MPVQARLTVVGGKASKRTVALQLPTSIGRSRDAGLTVAHPQISRKHCELLESDGFVVIRDVGSLNGTYVDNKRIKEAPLQPDATFTIGPLTFRIQYELDGKRGPLPPIIPDEKKSAATVTFSETRPVAPDPAKAENEAAAQKSSPAEDADDDPALDDFLKGLT